MRKLTQTETEKYRDQCCRTRDILFLMQLAVCRLAHSCQCNMLEASNIAAKIRGS